VIGPTDAAGMNTHPFTARTIRVLAAPAIEAVGGDDRAAGERHLVCGCRHRGCGGVVGK